MSVHSCWLYCVYPLSSESGSVSEKCMSGFFFFCYSSCSNIKKNIKHLQETLTLIEITNNTTLWRFPEALGKVKTMSKTNIIEAKAIHSYRFHMMQNVLLPVFSDWHSHVIKSVDDNYFQVGVIIRKITKTVSNTTTVCCIRSKQTSAALSHMAVGL